MRLLFSFCFILGLAFQGMSQLAGGKDPRDAYPINAALAPFYHGVASGDPLADGVIIWTRYTPPASLWSAQVEVKYFLYADQEGTMLVTQGAYPTDANRDFTVKVDVRGLRPATTYYYQFEVDGQYSIMGRTRTAGNPADRDLRFAVVSCSNYQQGYFNGYRHIARIRDIDAVIHLGDYIYEYGSPGYGYADSVGRVHIPTKEIVSLFDYRTRYNQYRLDPDLQAIHQMHPFICVWDDHESTNDSFETGAQNHQPNEGDWESRKGVSKQAYFEWLPIREQEEQKIYRTLAYGDLVDLIMIDSRLEGREQQIMDAENPEINASKRTILGRKQREWLLHALAESKAKWRIIGNQVIFTPVYAKHVSADLQNGFMDSWSGYPAERQVIIDHIIKQNVENIVVVTGDFHTSWAFEIPDVDRYFVENAAPTRSVGVEFASPSITSANFDEVFVNSRRAANLQQAQFAVNLAKQGLLNSNFPGTEEKANPHVRYANLIDHGYFLLHVNADRVQADFYYIDTYTRLSEGIRSGGSLLTTSGSMRLNESTPITLSSLELEHLNQAKLAETPVIMGRHSESEMVLFAVPRNGNISMEDNSGTSLLEMTVPKGLHAIKLDTKDRPLHHIRWK